MTTDQTPPAAPDIHSQDALLNEWAQRLAAIPAAFYLPLSARYALAREVVAALQEARDQVVRLTRERGALSDELDLAIWRAGHALEAAGLPKNAKDFLTGALDYLAPAAASPPPSSVHAPADEDSGVPDRWREGDPPPPDASFLFAPAPSLPTLEQEGDA